MFISKLLKHSLTCSIFVSVLAAASVSALGDSKAYAQCGWLDPTCDPSKWNRPPITFPRPNPNGSESCLAVMSYPEEYNWSLRNDKSYLQTFWLDGKEYTLGAGRSLSFTSKVGSYCTSSCSCSTTYVEPTIEFDRFVDDGKFTSHKVTVNVTKYRVYNFWKDGSIIKFSSQVSR